MNRYVYGSFMLSEELASLLRAKTIMAMSCIAFLNRSTKENLAIRPGLSIDNYWSFHLIILIPTIEQTLSQSAN